MQIAIDGAGFTPAKADELRRAMATFRHNGTIHKFKTPFIEGMKMNGYDEEFAERCFRQIEGFGEYGFPESHAASFAILVYASSYMKHHYPEVFVAALLNSQPMGFYAPVQLVRDAKEHGVDVRPPDINASDWDCTLEPGLNNRCALRLGLRQVTGLSEAAARQMVARRGGDPYRNPCDLWRRSGLARRQIIALARADAFASLGLTRRDVLWAVRGFSDGHLPLLDMQRGVSDLEPVVALPGLTMGEQVVDDYSGFSMSLRSHPLELLRATFAQRGLSNTEALKTSKNGDVLTLAGLVLVRQRPGTASGVVFVTLEDEFGIANLVVWPKVFDAHRRIVMGARLMGVRGRIQCEGDEPYKVIHLVADGVWDLSAELDSISELDMFRLTDGRGDEVRTDPGDRRMKIAEANATRHRASRNVPAKPADKPGYDRSRTVLDRPRIRIRSRDFH